VPGAEANARAARRRADHWDEEAVSSGLRERLARAIAPEAVSLTTEYVERLRAAHDLLKLRNAFLERDNKQLLRKVMKLKDQARGR
jgi:hypothetical protein